MEKNGKNGFLDFPTNFWIFLLYGSWEALDSSKILPRGPPTFSTPGQPIPRLFQKSKFWGPISHQISTPKKHESWSRSRQRLCSQFMGPL